MSDQQPFQVTKRAVKTALPVDTTELSIRRMDWRRIYRKTRSIPRKTSVYPIIAAALLGVSTTAFLSLIPLYQATHTVEEWIKPTYWAVGIGSFVISVAMFLLTRERGNQIQSSCEEVLRDMSDINNCYFPGDKLDDKTAD